MCQSDLKFGHLHFSQTKHQTLPQQLQITFAIPGQIKGKYSNIYPSLCESYFLGIAALNFAKRTQASNSLQIVVMENILMLNFHFLSSLYYPNQKSCCFTYDIYKEYVNHIPDIVIFYTKILSQLDNLKQCIKELQLSLTCHCLMHEQKKLSNCVFLYTPFCCCSSSPLHTLLKQPLFVRHHTVRDTRHNITIRQQQKKHK